MKRSTVIITVLLFLAIAITIPSVLAAQGSPRGYRGRMMGFQGAPSPPPPPQIHGWAYANFTEEQREQLEEVLKNFFDETTDLRNDLRTKATELTNILSSAEPDADKAKAIQKEISDLQAKLAQKRLELRLEVIKINPDARYRQGMFRRNMMGFGR